MKIRFLSILLVAFFVLTWAPMVAAQAVTTCPDRECPASVANEIAAAWATEGYYFQADMIRQLEETDLGLWAPLLYIFSVIGFLIMMAMGQPPRTYIWFAIGPAIFHWLLFTKQEAKGVSWEMYGVPGDQKIVWKLSHTGILNSNYRLSKGFTVSKVSGPSQGAEVSMFFLWADQVISSTVAGLSAITGFNVRTVRGATEADLHQAPGSSGTSGTNDRDKQWVVLSNTKWPMLENITSSVLFSEDLRESFVTFMASECGDIVSDFIDEGAYLQAMNRKTEIPTHVLREEQEFIKRLAQEKIPIPSAIYDALADNMSGGSNSQLFREFNNELRLAPRSRGEWLRIDCAAYLYLVMQGMRWEAGHAYNQFIQEAADHGVTEDTIIFNFLYGWDIKNGNNLSIQEQKNFIQDLILLHVFRNEMALAPTKVTPRWSSSERSINYSEAYHRQVGSKSKYGELYTWAKMMPYMQGLLLYIIAAAYPFCCILVVMPGWHKIMFTWLGFFAWAKSWDFGFAMVMAIERSLWAMLGNTKEAFKLHERVYAMQSDIGSITVDCKVARDPLTNFCSLPEITDFDGPQTMEKAVRLFDTALSMAGSLELDLKNSYYIYLMSALYFAVPAITGQVLLGARSGASSMVNTMVGQTSQQGGGKAAEGFSSEFAHRAQLAGGVTGRTAYSKALRSKAGTGADFLGKSLDHEGLSAVSGVAGGVLDANSQALGSVAAINGSMNTSRDHAMGTASSLVEFGAGYRSARRRENAARDAYLGTLGSGPTEAAPKAAGKGGVSNPSTTAAAAGGGGSGSGSKGKPLANDVQQYRSKQDGDAGDSQTTGASSGKKKRKQAKGSSSAGSSFAGGTTGSDSGGGDGGGDDGFIGGSDGGEESNREQRARIEQAKAQREYEEARAAKQEHMARGMFGVLSANRRAANHNAFSRANAGIMARQAGMKRSSAIAGMEGQSHGAMARRYGEFATQQASDAKWKAMRDWSKQVAGNSSAMGMLVGTFNAGDKHVTSMNGLAGLGELGAYHQAGVNNMRLGNTLYGRAVTSAKGQMIRGNDPRLQYQAATPVQEVTRAAAAGLRHPGRMGTGLQNEGYHQADR